MERRNDKIENGGTPQKETGVNPIEMRSSVPGDLPDNPRDADKLQPELTTIDLPDVADIPGQENITVPPMGELGDTTISSDDEEGAGLFDEALEDEV